MTTISAERIAALLAKREELSAQLSSGDLPTDRFIALSKEYAEVEPVAAAAGELQSDLRDRQFAFRQDFKPQRLRDGTQASPHLDYSLIAWTQRATPGSGSKIHDTPPTFGSRARSVLPRTANF